MCFTHERESFELTPELVLSRLADQHQCRDDNRGSSVYEARGDPGKAAVTILDPWGAPCPPLVTHPQISRPPPMTGVA
jgi:hypothetical protein